MEEERVLWKYSPEIASIQALSEKMLVLFQRSDFAGALGVLGLLQRRIEEKIQKGNSRME